MAALAIRSLLFAPADSEAKILKAISSPADAVIIDLEDAVPPESKASARGIVREILAGADRKGKPIFVRVNAFDTGMTSLDVAAVIQARPWGIMLPKASCFRDIERLGHYLDALEAREGVAEGSTLVATVATETASSTLALGRLDRAAMGRLWGMLWGGEDLSAALGAFGNRDADGAYTFPYQFARSQCLFAASALGVQPIDSVYTDFRDVRGLECEAQAGARDGFTAKAAIHPAQVETINRIFTPRPEQLDWARQVVSLLNQVGVARLDGKMIDIAHKRIAERLLARAALSRG
jgi:citrate lyase subunit beta / citryl-CoA lyase